MSFDFGYTLSLTKSNFSHNFKNYLKTDMKKLLLHFLVFYALLLLWVYYSFSTNTNAGDIGQRQFYYALLLNIVFYFTAAYVFNRIVYSKSFYIYNSYYNSGISYKESFDYINKANLNNFSYPFHKRLFLLIIGFVINVIYVYFLFGNLFLTSSPLSKILNNMNPFSALFILIIVIFELGPVLIIGLIVASPIQLFSSFLQSHNLLLSKDDFNNSQSLLNTRSDKIKFFILALVLIHYYGFILELFSGIAFAVITFFLIIYSIAISASYGGANSDQTLIYNLIIILTFIFTAMFAFSVELEGCVIGSLYGQTYLNVLQK